MTPPHASSKALSGFRRHGMSFSTGLLECLSGSLYCPTWAGDPIRSPFPISSRCDPHQGLLIGFMDLLEHLRIASLVGMMLQGETPVGMFYLRT